MGLQAESEKKNNSIYILLSDYPDQVSRLLKRIGFWKYSHASIGTSLTAPDFFSFTGKRGFRIEKPWKHPTYRGQPVPCALYKLPVSEAVFRKVAGDLRRFSEQGERYKYSYFGLLVLYLGCRFNTKNRYTCSGFVSKVLENSGALSPKLCRKLVKPDDFAEKLYKNNVFEGTLKELFVRERAI